MQNTNGYVFSNECSITEGTFTVPKKEIDSVKYFSSEREALEACASEGKSYLHIFKKDKYDEWEFSKRSFVPTNEEYEMLNETKIHSITKDFRSQEEKTWNAVSSVFESLEPYNIEDILLYVRDSDFKAFQRINKIYYNEIHNNQSYCKTHAILEFSSYSIKFFTPTSGREIEIFKDRITLTDEKYGSACAFQMVLNALPHYSYYGKPHVYLMDETTEEQKNVFQKAFPDLFPPC